jgi:hypothetical protein
MKMSVEEVDFGDFPAKRVQFFLEKLENRLFLVVNGATLSKELDGFVVVVEHFLLGMLQFTGESLNLCLSSFEGLEVVVGVLNHFRISFLEFLYLS